MQKLLWPFFQLMLSGAGLFVLSVGLAQPFAGMVVHMNAPDFKPLSEWGVFSGLSLLCGALWCACWVWFKRSEKRCVELLK